MSHFVPLQKGIDETFEKEAGIGPFKKKQKTFETTIDAFKIFFFKLVYPQPRFRLFSSFRTMHIHYTLMGFEPTTFGT